MGSNPARNADRKNGNRKNRFPFFLYSEAVLIQQDSEFSAQGDDIFDAFPGIHYGDCFGMGGAVPVVILDLFDDGHLGSQYSGGIFRMYQKLLLCIGTELIPHRIIHDPAVVNIPVRITP